MRCMTIAEELRQRGIFVSFISREIRGHMCDLIEAKGFTVYRLPRDNRIPVPRHESSDYSHLLEANSDRDALETEKIINERDLHADWIIVDHYALDSNWERAMRPFTRNIMVIDDLADRHHDCEILLDQNLYKNMDIRYDGLIQHHTLKLLGPEFALLRPEFRNLRKIPRSRNEQIKKFFIFFGGSDPDNETSKAIEAVAGYRHENIMVDIVIGASNPNRPAIEAMADQYPYVNCHNNVNYMARLMFEADICIGAAGGTTWERCCLGLPSLVITVAENQVEATQCLHENNILYYIGDHLKVTVNDIRNALDLFYSSPELLNQYTKNSMALVDGMGAHRCIDMIQKAERNQVVQDTKER